MEYAAIITVLALIQFTYFSLLVGQARAKYNVKAPATTGNEYFERAFRVQQNTLEQLVVFVPALWIFAYYMHGPTAAGLGLIYLAGRFVYQRSYTQDPAKRGAGFVAGFFASIILMVGGLIGALLAVF